MSCRIGPCSSPARYEERGDGHVSVNGHARRAHFASGVLHASSPPTSAPFILLKPSSLGRRSWSLGAWTSAWARGCPPRRWSAGAPRPRPARLHLQRLRRAGRAAARRGPRADARRAGGGGGRGRAGRVRPRPGLQPRGPAAVPRSVRVCGGAARGCRQAGPAPAPAL